MSRKWSLAPSDGNVMRLIDDLSMIPTLTHSKTLVRFCLSPEIAEIPDFVQLASLALNL